MIWTPAYTKLAIGAVVLCAAGVVFHDYEASVRREAVSNAVQKAQGDLQKQYAQQFSDLQKQVAERDAAYKQQVQSLRGQFQSAITPQQVAQVVSQAMGLKEPATIVRPTPTKENPNPQPVGQVSSVDFPQIKQYTQDCETCKLQVPKLQADLADREAQAKLAQQTIDSLKEQRDVAVTASKGGSWIKRTFKVVKVVACATAGGAAGGASGKGAIPAAIGAGAGAVACSLF